MANYSPVRGRFIEKNRGYASLTREEDIKTYLAVLKEMVTHEPAGMLLVANAMVWPEIHVEVEAIALVPSGR